MCRTSRPSRRDTPAMRWEDVYELWIEHGWFGVDDDVWVILDRQTARRVEICSYKTEEEAKAASQRLFDRFVEESEKILLG